MSEHRTDDGATERPGAAEEISAAVTGDPMAEPREDYDPERRDAAGAPLPGEDPGDMKAHGGSIAGGEAHP